MNILVVCHYGLYEEFSFSFVHNQIKEYVGQGHRVRALIPNGFGKTGRDGKRIGKGLHISCIDGVELYDLRYLTLSRYGEKAFNVQSAIGGIRTHWKKLFHDFQPDVIHAHTLGFDSRIGAWLKQKLGCPLVVTTHGSDSTMLYKNGEKACLRTLCDQADAVVCVSTKLKRQLEDCGTSARLETILNGFQVQEIGSVCEKAPYSWIQVGNLIPSKGFDVTIRAFAKLRDKYPESRLTIIGKGGQREALEALCQQLNLAEAVQFLGQLPNARVLAEMAKAQFYVMPSSPEGFGIVYLEAMAAGCLAIGTEGEGIADLIINGENGYLVSANDPDAIANIIDKSLQDPENAVNIARQGQKAARELTWEKNAGKYIWLFQELGGQVDL